MKKQNKSKEWAHVETLPQYSLYRHRIDRLLWQIRLPRSGGYVRRRFRATDLEQALREGPRAVGLADASTAVKEITLVEVLKAALEASHRRIGSESTDHWWYCAGRFVKWLQAEYPSSTTWTSLNRHVMRDYLRSMKNLADNTRRLYMQPLVQADVYMSSEHELPRLTANLRLGSKLRRPVGEIYIVDVLDLLRFLRHRWPYLEVAVALTGLAGLSVLEALRLTWSHVDLERGLIEVTGPKKNDYRERVIPVCSVVLESLRLAHESQQHDQAEAAVIEVDGHVVVGRGGSAFVHHDGYRLGFNRARNAWNAEIALPPKDLRNCILTFADDRGIRCAIWEEYVGHAVGGVSKDHYVPRLQSRSRGLEDALDRKIASFRRLVIEPLEEGIREAREKLLSSETCKELATPKRNAAG